jgi:hypothetical protein
MKGGRHEVGTLVLCTQGSVRVFVPSSPDYGAQIGGMAQGSNRYFLQVALVFSFAPGRRARMIDATFRFVQLAAIVILPTDAARHFNDTFLFLFIWFEETKRRGKQKIRSVLVI